MSSLIRKAVSLGPGLMMVPLLLSTACAVGPGGDAGKVVVCRPVAREEAPYVDLNGRFDAFRAVDLRAQVTGTLEQVLFQPGKIVEAGARLFEIDDRLYRIGLDRAVGEVQRAEARLKRATVRLDRARALRSNNAILEAEAVQAEADHKEAGFLLQAARPGLDVAKLRLESTRVTAPFRGRIDYPVVAAGNLVIADQTVLATIMTVDPVAVVFEVDERTVLQLRKQARESGGKGDMRLGPVVAVAVALADETDFPHKGKLAEVADRFDPDTDTLRCRAIVSNPDELILPGMFARLRMTTGKPVRRLLVPERAFILVAGKTGLYVVNDQGVVAFRAVTLPGPLYGDLRVVEGINADDWVVVQADWSHLKEGGKYQVEKVAAPTSP
jgi:membrane fusion protein, multidrug efflux system